MSIATEVRGSPSPVYESDPDEILVINEDSQEPQPLLRKRRKIITETSRPTLNQKSDYAKFIDKINFQEPDPLLIKDALLIGHSYKLLKITHLETRWGTKLVWLLKDADDGTPPLKIYGTKTLSRYVTKNKHLCPVMVNCLKSYRINYHGYLDDEHNGVAKYHFTISK